MRILLTGGSGLLGTELQKIWKDDMITAPSHKEFDIADPDSWNFIPATELVIHAAAYTDVPNAENDPQCLKTNVIGTLAMANKFSTLPFVFISSEYASYDGNEYAKSKRAGELIVAKTCPNHLIIRTLFKPNPFPFPRAFVDQYTMGDYVDVIAPLIMKAIKEWDKEGGTMAYIGTGRKSIYELAKRSVPDVGEIWTDEITNVKIPKDYL